MTWKPFLRLMLLFLLVFPSTYFQTTASTAQDEVIVAVLDTGVDDSHPLLAGQVIHGWDFIDQDPLSEDQTGHGTHVAGIIKQNAPEAKILAIRMITGQDVQHTAQAILYAISHGADIVNMSFIEPYDVLTEQVIQFGISQGVVFVASSGNQQEDAVYYPAKYEGVLSVAAVDENFESIYGNYGEGLTYAAPGINIESAYLDGENKRMTGTSMSAAYASGVIAYVKQQYPQGTVKQLQYILETHVQQMEAYTLLRTREQVNRSIRVLNMEHMRQALHIPDDPASEPLKTLAVVDP
ncbi:S8 family peptidase [Marinicrinis sediminis]|uniref:S8 family serine peptidase n=1 Tax=Marinicrinis sediminis TaxID=1652465 RepID=A0ABW5RDL6_9BACL